MIGTAVIIALCAVFVAVGALSLWDREGERPARSVPEPRYQDGKTVPQKGHGSE